MTVGGEACRELSIILASFSQSQFIPILTLFILFCLIVAGSADRGGYFGEPDSGLKTYSVISCVPDTIVTFFIAATGNS